MTDIITPDNAALADYLLAAMRCARLRLQLLQNELDQIGIAMKTGMVSDENALVWLSEVGLLQFIDINIKKETAAA